MNFDLKAAIGSIAPTLATMLGGPLAGTAVSAIAAAFGLAPTAGQGDITQVIQNGAMTPETIAAVRAADQKHAEILGQQGLDLQKLNADYQTAMAEVEVKDRDSARRREMDVKDNTPAHLAYMIIGGFFAVSIAQLVALMGFGEIAAKIPPQGWLLIGNISGYLAAEAKAAASYYFGTTQGSDKKTDLLAKAQPVDG